jgi:hypothetical protein
LAIADRGYCDAVGIAHVLEQRADVLVRYAATALPAQRRASGEEFDAILGIRGLTDDAVLDLPISFEHDRKRVHGRFIASRLPPAEAEEARRRVRLEHGPRITAEALETAGYLVLFTTVPSERLSASKCLLAFQLRRNIEDRLEQWRSLCGFERLPNYRDDTIVAWIYAKLLLALLLDRMSSRELSPPVQFEPVAPKPRRKRRSKTDLCMGTGEHRIADEEDAPVSAAAS